MDDISVDDLLGVGGVEEEITDDSHEDEETEGLRGSGVFIDEKAAKGEIEELISNMRFINKRSKNMLVDIRAVDFHASENDMYLTFKDPGFYDKPFYFKNDPDDANNPKIIHAQKQFCKIIGVPHSFFKNNRPPMKERMVSTWQISLNAEEKPKKTQFIARVREKEDHAVIRALLPIDYTTLDNHEILELVSSSVSYTHKLYYKVGAATDDLIFHARFLFDNPFKIKGEDVCLGFSITSSELGASSLDVDIFVHHVLSDSDMTVTYGGDPFFSVKYTGIRSEELKEIFPSMIERINNEEEEIKQRIEEKLYEIYPLTECMTAKNLPGLPAKFKKSLFLEASEAGDDMTCPWDFARHMSMIAKEFDIVQRIKIERAIGAYLNLVFPA